MSQPNVIYFPQRAMMTTKELLLREIEQLDEEELEALLVFIRESLEQKGNDQNIGFLERLSEIAIDGPQDFAENHDLYLNGKKSLDDARR
jgi:hypothetical protein